VDVLGSVHVLLTLTRSFNQNNSNLKPELMASCSTTASG